jgi:hypothetical protein
MSEGSNRRRCAGSKAKKGGQNTTRGMRRKAGISYFVWSRRRVGGRICLLVIPLILSIAFTFAFTLVLILVFVCISVFFHILLLILITPITSLVLV